MKSEADKLLFYKVSLWSSVIFVIIMASAFGYTIYQFQMVTKQSIDKQLSSVRSELLDLLNQSSSKDVAEKILALNKDITNKIHDTTNVLDKFKGAVVAFDLKSCPEGWELYKPAQGRFIRGIDKSERKIDPDGERSPGDLQGDGLKAHGHTITLPGASGNNAFVSRMPSWGYDDWHGAKTEASTNATGDSESRPINVALLYCKKT